MVFCAFILLGFMIHLTACMYFIDAMVFLIAIPNIIGLYLLKPLVKREVNQYLEKIRSGEIKKTG